MILVDTSVWVDHLRHGDHHLAGLLEANRVLVHPFVIGELACGNLRRRQELMRLLRNMPQARVAAAEEVLEFIEGHRLMGRGIGYVDAHLLAAVALESGARLWSRDQRLRTLSAELGTAYTDGQ